MCNIQSLVGQACGSNAGGTRTKMWYCPASEFNGFPDVKTTTGAGDTVTLDGPFTFVATVGKGYWREVDILINTGSVVDTVVGEVGGKAMENVLTGHVVGTGAAQLEFIKNLLNTPVVAMIKDREGVHRVVGRNDDPAYIDTGEATTGVAIADKRGVAFSLKAASGTPSLVYDADTDGIDITPHP